MIGRDIVYRKFFMLEREVFGRLLGNLVSFPCHGLYYIAAMLNALMKLVPFVTKPDWGSRYGQISCGGLHLGSGELLLTTISRWVGFGFATLVYM